MPINVQCLSKFARLRRRAEEIIDAQDACYDRSRKRIASGGNSKGPKDPSETTEQEGRKKERGVKGKGTVKGDEQGEQPGRSQ